MLATESILMYCACLPVQVTTKSVEDLKLYEKAMSWAMTVFHQEKMKMINDVVRDLWRHIYRGNDIDYIEVKTDTTTSVGGSNSIHYEKG